MGKTNIYLFPYGEYPKHDTDAYKVFLEYGFNYFSGVGLNTYQKVYKAGYVFDDRKNIDGMTMRSCIDEGPNGKKDNGDPSTRSQVWKMMDVSYVMDKKPAARARQGCRRTVKTTHFLQTVQYSV